MKHGCTSPVTPNHKAGAGYRKAIRHAGIQNAQNFGPSYNVKTQSGINTAKSRPGRNVNRLPIPKNVHDTDIFGRSEG